MLTPVGGASAQAAQRGFELITPADSLGYQTAFDGLDPRNSEHVFYNAVGSGGSPAFLHEDGGSPDIVGAQRTASGWQPIPLTQYCVGSPAISGADPACPTHGLKRGPFSFLAGTGGAVVFETTDDIDPHDDNNTAVDVYRADGAGVALLSAPAGGDTAVPGANGAQDSVVSTDLSTVAFDTYGALLPADTDSFRDVYANIGGTLTLVSATAGGATPLCTTVFCDASLTKPITHPVSSDGSRIFFTDQSQLDPAADTDGQNDVYMRDGSTLKLLSGNPGGGPAVDQSAQFQWASKDGSRAFFSTTEPLLASDTDTAVDVYMANTSTGQLTLVTPGSSNDSASLAIASDDGSHVLFTTAEPLATAPSDAASKLYLWSDGTVSYVGELSPGDSLMSTDPADRQARATPDGSVFAFSTPAQLVPADTNSVSDVYALRNGSLELVSRRPAGADTSDAVIGSLEGGLFVQGRVLSEHGSRMFFSTADALVPEDTDGGHQDVYESDSGTIRLVSSPGSTPTDDAYADSSPDGSDVYFTTNSTLVPADADGGAIDVYDARIGGGFPAAASSTVGAPPARSGPAVTPEPAGTGTVAPQPGDNLTPGEPGKVVGPKTPGPVSIGTDSATIDGHHVELSLDAPAAGRLRVQITARGSGPDGTLASGGRSVAAAGPVSLRLRLTHGALRWLRRHGRMRVTVSGTFTADSGTPRAFHGRAVLHSDRLYVPGRHRSISHRHARVLVAVPAAGRVTVVLHRGASGHGRVLARGRRTARRAGRVHVTVRLTKGGRRLLHHRRHVRAQRSVRFAPAGDGAGLVAHGRVKLAGRSGRNR